MEIDFKKIRPLHGDQRLGFEELCCQLAEIDVERETQPHFASRSFLRKEGKAGDSGVECYYCLPDGSDWGWQAKYFIDGLGPSQWSNIDESVKKALEGHPSLVRYTICLPINLSDPRVPGKTSQMDHWRKGLTKWDKWAKEKGRSMEFILWGEFELRTRLMALGDRGAGYIFYWFGAKVLTAEWFRDRIAEAVKDAGARYTPDLNVALPTAEQFDAFGRTDAFLRRIDVLYDLLLRKCKRANSAPQDLSESPEFSEAISGLANDVQKLGEALDNSRRGAFGDVGIEEVLSLTAESMRKTSRSMEILERLTREKEGAGKSSRHAHSSLAYHLSELESALDDVAEFADSIAVRVATHRAMLLSGNAGTGKTHLFCDLAEKRIRDGLPTVLLMGQKFCNGLTPLSQMVNHLHLGDMAPEIFLGALDTAAWVCGKRAFILIDALNEGAGAEFWTVHLAGLLETIGKFPRIVLAASCRDSYIDIVVPEHLLKTGVMYQLRHHGFEGREFQATSSFFKYYGIQSPAEPLLFPEFSNPLFLKLMCSGLKNEGKTHVPKGLKGISKLFDLFINSVNGKLSKKLRMDLKENIVRRVVDALAERMGASGQAWLERSEAKLVINQIRPEPDDYERTLFRNLLDEGLLSEDRYWVDERRCRTDGVSFAYHRLTDHLMAALWLKTVAGKKNPKASLKSIPSIKTLIEDERFARRNAGWVEALSIQMPELLNLELVQLDPGMKKRSIFRYAFLTSLLWRDPKKVGKGAIRFLNELLRRCSQDEFESTMEVLLMLACDSDHRLNARSLHRWLSGFSMADRDHVWSMFLHDQYQREEEGPVHRLIDWAWNADKARAKDEIIELCGIVLTWFLTSSNRFLRDRATKALVSMLSQRPRVLLRVLDHFVGVNDPYVMERLYAVAYGVAMLTDDCAALSEVAERVYTHIFEAGSPPTDILLRDYARGVIEVAGQRGALASKIVLDVARPPYRSPWPPTIPLASELPGATEHSGQGHTRGWSLYQLRYQILGQGYPESDWAIYELRPACEQFAWVPPEDLGLAHPPDKMPQGKEIIHERFDVRLAQPWIMQRVLDLGWTTERFGLFDHRVSEEAFYRRMHVSKPERISKKYAWVAMHEFLGLLSDHVDFCGDNWGDEQARYCGPWQIIGLRDIDPSLLMIQSRRTERPQTPRCWWRPVEFQFVEHSPEDHKDWVRDCSDLFDPRDLIQVSDAQKREWLELEGFHDWGEDAPPGEDRYEIPRRNLWFMIKSYIVKSRHSPALIRWISAQSLWGRWMPESEEFYRAFLGEYPWASSFEPYDGNQGWTKKYRSELPHQVVVTAMEYKRERGYDCSIDEHISGLLPSPWLVRSMGLRWSRKGFSFLDENDAVVAFDPSEHEAGPSVLLVSKEALSSFLRETKCDLIWTVLGERRVLHPIHRSPKKEYEGRTIIQGIYRLHNGKVTGGPLRADFER